MQVAIAAAGFTPGEADKLRTAMGHKRSRERMAAICQKMIDGMTANGISQDDAERIFNQINGFADYGFPESHAASFALLVYAAAYLKHYYAPEFTAAILNAQPMGFYAPGTLVEDARRHGVDVLPVDASRSRWDSTLEPRGRTASRCGSGSASCAGWAGRRASCCSARSRAAAPSRRSTMWCALGARSARAARISPRPARSTASCRMSRAAEAARGGVAVLEVARGDAGPLAPSRIKLDVPTPVAAMSPREITEADYRMTGISLNGHPMRHVRAMLRANGVRTAREILALPRRHENVATAGLVICRQRPGTAKGFVFLTLEDETGLVNVVVLPKLFEKQALLISRRR